MSNEVRIPLAKPSITELEVAYAADAARNGWGEQCYDYINKFEAAFRDHIGVKHAIATSSCTGALHLGLAALGIGPGDEVILADTNWIATVAPIAHLGATPVMVDILQDTWCVDPGRVEAALTSKTKAIIATHIYGNLCEMDGLLAIGEKYGVHVIEDAAEAIGSVYRGRRAGSMGVFSGFSFHGSKTITTGEGGMFVTNDSALHERVLTLSNHGRSRHEVKQFWPEVLGYKFKMSNIQAAIGCAQTERVQALVHRRREILATYREKLSIMPGISMNAELDGTCIGAWMPTVVFAKAAGITAESIIPKFQARNVDARVFFHPLSSLPIFDCQSRETLAADIAARAINLPSFHDMTASEIDRVVAIIEDAIHA
ncbi:DegT/DnrJ/EryC1/StrS family aminotransferase [Rhodoferax sp.]|uniref:DegT/DnrJ/EryC1/StrS family aminotransferase n=1 Tax=Rhodoferax sp. TaxID=50421 RepID=UPI00275E85E0|nr:DegT/DnrJ/EryC1/StrS family aminotransferase [Rhodoferax sp.]